jgi:hypothetical protein
MCGDRELSFFIFVHVTVLNVVDSYFRSRAGRVGKHFHGKFTPVRISTASYVTIVRWRSAVWLCGVSTKRTL